MDRIQPTNAYCSGIGQARVCRNARFKPDIVADVRVPCAQSAGRIAQFLGNALRERDG